MQEREPLRPRPYHGHGTTPIMPDTTCLLSMLGALVQVGPTFPGPTPCSLRSPSPHFPACPLHPQGRKWPGGITMQLLAIRARSKGSVGLKAADPWTNPAIDINYFSDREDLETLKRGVRMARDIARQEPLRKYLVEVGPRRTQRLRINLGCRYRKLCLLHSALEHWPPGLLHRDVVSACLSTAAHSPHTPTMPLRCRFVVTPIMPHLPPAPTTGFSRFTRAPTTETPYPAHRQPPSTLPSLLPTPRPPAGGVPRRPHLVRRGH